MLAAIKYTKAQKDICVFMLWAIIQAQIAQVLMSNAQ